jgi:hypothetical protein
MATRKPHPIAGVTPRYQHIGNICLADKTLSNNAVVVGFFGAAITD